MPLSEHEQRMLEQIENALYAEDPKFASSVKNRRLGRGGGGGRRRVQALAVFIVGLVLLVGGLAVGVKIGGFPVVSLVGFLLMFGAGLIALLGTGDKKPGSEPEVEVGRGAKPRGGAKRNFSERMEERFNRRFEQE